MGIRLEHQGAGAGAGIDLVSQQKRKYDLRLQQQEKQQDLMTKIGLQNREAMMRQQQDREQADVRQNWINAANERQDMNWARDQKAIEDQRKRAASNARAMKTGTIRSSIEMGDYDPADADKLRGFLEKQDDIIADPKSTDAQKDEALAQLDGMMAPFIERKKARVPQAPVPYEQADPKLQGQILADVYKRLNESGRQYTDAEARALARDDYNDRVGISQAPQLGGQAPTEGDSREMTPRVAQLSRTEFSQQLRQDLLFGPAPSGQSGQTVPMQGTPGQERLYGPAPVKKPTTGFEASQNTKEFAPYRAEAEKDIEAEYQRKLQEWNDGDGDPNRPEKPAPPTRQEKQALAEKYWDDDYKRVQQADWSDFDKKNYGNGYVEPDGKKFVAIPGATVKPHVWESGDKGFAVEGDDGYDHYFKSEAAAKAFAATGEQEGGQSPQQGGAPPQQAAPQQQAAAEPKQQGAAPHHKPMAGATVEDYTFPSGWKGFKVRKEGGGALTFASREMAEAFLARAQPTAVTQPVSPPAGTQPAPRIDATIPPPPVPGQPRSAEPMGQPSSSVQATEVPGQFAYGSPDRQIGGRPVSDFTSVWGQFVDEMSRPAASHTRQDKTPPPEPERKQLPPQNQPPIKWDPRYDALPDAPPIEWGDGKFVNQHSRQKKSSMSPRMQEIKKHYDTLPPDAQNTFRHAMGRDERMRNVAIERLRQEGKDGGLFGDGPANPEHQSKLYGVGGNAGTVQDFFNKTSSAQPTAPQDAPQVFNPRENLNRLNAQKMRANQNPVASPPEGGATTNAPAPQDTTQAPLPRAAPSLDWGQAYERYKADPVSLKRVQNAEAAYNNAVDDTAKNAIGLLLTEQPHEVKARAAKILKDKYGIVLSEIMGRQ